jgi:hypothetical protein
MQVPQWGRNMGETSAMGGLPAKLKGTSCLQNLVQSPHSAYGRKLPWRTRRDSLVQQPRQSLALYLRGLAVVFWWGPITALAGSAVGCEFPQRFTHGIELRGA